MNELADQLEAHVVLEEGEVYSLLERVLPREALEEIRKRLAAFESESRVEPWVPSRDISYDPLPGLGDSEGGGFDWR